MTKRGSNRFLLDCSSIELLLMALALLSSVPLMRAEGQYVPDDQQNQQPAAQKQQPNETESAAGGPSGDTGVIAVPKKNPNEAHIGCPDHINSVVYRLERIVPSDK